MNPDPYSMLDVSWRSAVLLSIVCAIVATAVTLSLRGVETKASRYLALFLCLFCLNLVPQIIGFAGFYQAFPELTFAPFNNELWLGPLLLFHTLTLVKHPVDRRLYWFFLPGIVQTLYYTTVFFAIDSYQQKWAYSDAFHSVYILPVESLLTVGISGYCVWLSFKHARQYQTQLLDLKSNLEPFDISWLTWLVTIVGVLVVSWSGFELVHRFVDNISYMNQFPFHVAFSLLVLVLSQRALSSLRLPFPAPIAPVISESATEVRDNLKERKLADDIVVLLQQSKSYLNQQFSLSDLARTLGTNETYISRAINNQLNKNFNALINEIRVEHAKQLIRADTKSKLLDVMFDSGFSSKASFNRCFKQFAGMTPSQFQAEFLG